MSTIFFCCRCGKQWRASDLVEFDTPERRKYMEEALKRQPDRLPYAACPVCGHPAYAYEDLFLNVETEVPSATSMQAYSPEKIMRGNQRILAYLMRIRQEQRELGAARFEMMEHFGKTYGDIGKAVSLLGRVGFTARTIAVKRNPETKHDNCIYAACPEMVQAFKDNVFPREFEHIGELNKDIRRQLRAMCALEAVRNEVVENLRARCREYYKEKGIGAGQ